jgi:hypothetical protein
VTSSYPGKLFSVKETETNSRLTQLPTLVGIGTFALVLLLCLSLIALSVVQLFGTTAWLSVSISFALTLGGSVLSFIMISRYAGQPHVAQLHLFGMLPRMAVPLAGLVYLTQHESVWLKTGGPEALISSYLVLLSVESVCAIQLLLPAGFSGGNSVKV